MAKSGRVNDRTRWVGDLLAPAVAAGVAAAAATQVPPAGAWVIGTLLGVGLAVLARRRSAPPVVGPGVGEEALRSELDRGRRYGRSFAIARLAGASAALDAGLHEHLRASDVAWHEDGDLWLVLPECTRADIVGQLQRLQDVVPDLRACLAAGAVSVASFPADGVTAGALRDLVRRPDNAVTSATDPGRDGHPPEPSVPRPAEARA